MMRRWYLACVFCLALAGAARAVTVDMDPVPRFPLRKGDDITFLVHLSGAKGACKGTASFKGLAAGLRAEPEEQAFELKPGEAKLLVFKVACTEWGADAVVRPTVTAAE